MNRTLLLIICDFLLLSLLALARFDTPEEETQDEVLPEDPIQVQGDIIDVLKLSLELEQVSNENMSASLQETQEALDETETSLSARELELEKERKRLEQLAKDNKNLESSLDDRIAVLETTKKEVIDLSELTREQEKAAVEQQRKLNLLEKELREKLDAIAAADLREKSLVAQKDKAEKESQALNTKLQVAETETRLVRENLQATSYRVSLIQEENKKLQAHATQLATQLTEGVAAQSEKLNEIVQEVRDSQPISPNIIYSNFIDSGVTIDVRYRKTGRTSKVDFIKSIHPVIVDDGGSLLALFTWADLKITETNLFYEDLNFRGDIRIGRYTFSLSEMEFLSVDPRVVAVPLKEEWREFLKADPYQLPNDPLKFEEVVLIDRAKGDYGKLKFFKNVATPGYFRVDSRFVNRLGGEVRPGNSNAMFTLSGEFLSLMVNREYAVHIENFLPAKTITVGGEKSLEELRAAHVRIKAQVARMPEDVQ